MTGLSRFVRSDRPKALDLFCCAGGMAIGRHVLAHLETREEVAA